MSIALCQNIARFLIAFLPGAIRNLFDFYMHGFCTLNSCCFFAKKRHLNGILGSLCCIFHLLQNLHHLPSILGFLPNFSCLFCWHFRTFCRAFHTFYWAFCTFYWAFTPFAELSHLLPSLNAFYRASTPFAELSRSLLNLHPCRIFLVCTALHVYPCIPHRILCFLYAPFVLFFCVICILRHAICAFSHAICTFSHTICAIFPYY